MRPGTATARAILGLSHLGLTVRDVPAAQRFWTSVMGFATLVEGDDFCMFFEPSSKLAIGVTNQQGQAAGSFDERRTGLDHVALAVADVATLLRWEQRLTELDVPHSPIAASDAGHHLNLRAPDDFPVELFVLSDEGAAEPRDHHRGASGRGHSLGSVTRPGPLITPASATGSSLLRIGQARRRRVRPSDGPSGE